jgi:hypothetical protein
MTDEASTAPAGSEAPASASGVSWGHADLPPGDAPPRSAARLWVSIAAFALWLGFLVAMALLRLNTTPH